MWRRRIPSSWAPILRMAAREQVFRALVLNSTRRQSQRSNAHRSIRYLASVLAPERCHSGSSQVQPISIRRWAGLALPNRVLPMTRPVSRTRVSKGGGAIALEHEMPHPREAVAEDGHGQEPYPTAATQGDGHGQEHQGGTHEMEPARDGITMLSEVVGVELAEAAIAVRHEFLR